MGVTKYFLTGMILQESGTLISMIPPRPGRRLTPCLAFRDEGAYRVTRQVFVVKTPPERCGLASLETNMAMKNHWKLTWRTLKNRHFLIRRYIFKLLLRVCPPQKKSNLVGRWFFATFWWQSWACFQRLSWNFLGWSLYSTFFHFEHVPFYLFF